MDVVMDVDDEGSEFEDIDEDDSSMTTVQYEQARGPVSGQLYLPELTHSIGDLTRPAWCRLLVTKEPGDWL